MLAETGYLSKAANTFRYQSQIKGIYEAEKTVVGEHH